MNNVINDILDKIHSLEKDLEREFEAQREGFRYRLEQRKVLFEQGVLENHRQLRKGLLRFWRDSGLLNFITSPVIYALVVPLMLLDLSLSFFQWVCFPIYGIKRVPRAEFIVIDRHHLAYLNWVEKLNCVYCGYANGVIAYGREIASRTEARWCPIKHARRIQDAHPRYWEFDAYGDGESYRARMNARLQRQKEDIG